MNRLVLRSRWEDAIRRSWMGRPNPGLRAAAAVYGLVSDTRNLAWTLRVVEPARCSAPVISIGGLTIGGSGKTPITASIARRLADDGSAVAVLTAGHADELAVHVAANADVHVAGGRNRSRLAIEAARQGATVVLLDSGFQHRRLHRDLDIVTILVDYHGNGERLPAGPFRERWAEIDRADAVVLVRRQAPPLAAEPLARELRRSFPSLHVAHARIAPLRLEPHTGAARSVDSPQPEVAVAGVMWPDAFFSTLADVGLAPAHGVSLPDHWAVDRSTVTAVVDRSGAGGLVCTAKDAAKLVAALPDEVPVWSVVEQVEWEEGGRRLLDATARVAGVTEPDSAGIS
ncbi:MAG: tetraacyldisaccharide 4'-kinase [Gemmatimonadota bacterium]